MPAASAQQILEVRDLRVVFPRRAGLFRRRGPVGSPTPAVDGISFQVAPGETLGLVGESGCGKTTAGRAILRLLPHNARVQGRASFEGRDMLSLRGRQLRRLRQRIQIVFQDPAGSLNPRMRVGDIVGEPLRVHRLVRSRSDLRARVHDLLARCGMPGENVGERYPHEFSGGQKQRICIARALATDPAFLICDEPTSALDVSVQAQILNLLKDLRRDLGLSMLFISHDMGVVRHMCDRIAVMNQGRIVESGSQQEVITTPREPYTQSLLRAVPRVRGGAECRAQSAETAGPASRSAL